MSTASLHSRLDRVESASGGGWNIVKWFDNHDAAKLGLPLPYPNLPPVPQDVIDFLRGLPDPD